VLSVYRVAPVTAGWAGMAAFVGAGGIFLPQPLSEIVVFPALAFFFSCLPGMVWLPRFMLPRWYRIQKGREPDPRLGVPHGAGRVERALPFVRVLGTVPAVDSAEDVTFTARIGGSEDRRSGGAEERRSGGAEERRSGGAVGGVADITDACRPFPPVKREAGE
jgi:hypothetical protein